MRIPGGKIRGLAIGVALVALVAAVVPFSGGRSPSAPPGGTVVLIILDTVRQDALGCYGHVAKPTPAIDAIAADGVRFTRAMSVSGWTLPSVASILTGTWPTIHGAAGKGTTLHAIREELPTATEVLRRSGLGTYGFANAAFMSPMLGVDRGFDHFDHEHTYNWDSRRANETIDAALPIVRERRGRPGFFLIHLFDPHLDYDPPGDYATRFTEGARGPRPPLSGRVCDEILEKAATKGPGAPEVRYVRGVYQGEIAFLDSQVGRLVGLLKTMNLYDEATIIVTADHGEEFLDHRSFEHGHTLYQELVHVPLIVKPPKSAGLPGGVVDTQVRTLDIMPTVFELLSVETPPTFRGESLLPLMRREPGEDRYSFHESTHDGPDRIAGNDGQYKVILTRTPDRGVVTELYDLRRDAGEQRDLARIEPQLAERLKRKVLDFQAGLWEAEDGLSVKRSVDLDPGYVMRLRSLGYLR